MEVNSTWLITSKLANQRARKVLFTCVLYTNGSYTMMAKPMKTLELHYPMIQFLLIYDTRMLPGVICRFTILREVCEGGLSHSSVADRTANNPSRYFYYDNIIMHPVGFHPNQLRLK